MGFDLGDFEGCVKVLGTILRESWVEVRPKVGEEGGSLLTGEGAEMLKVVVGIFGNFLDMREIFETAGVGGMTGAMAGAEARFLMGGFPYSVVRAIERGRKRQGDFGKGTGAGALEENLGVAVAVLGGVSGSFREAEREALERILEFVCGKFFSIY